MAFDYSAARETAKKLIENFGGAGSFVKSGNNGGYDDYGNPTPPEPDTTINGLVSPILSFKRMEIDGESILATDGYVFFHSEQAPEIGFTHTQNGKTYRFVSMLMEINSIDGINVFRKIQVRS